jgi:small subunit ribosomal protein S2
MKEHIAIREAQRLGIPVFAIVDTNSNPNGIDFVIPANDDSTKSIDLILTVLCDAIQEGMDERKIEKADIETSDIPVAKERKSKITKRARNKKEGENAASEKAAEKSEA